ncbi:LysR family transcriptional regulator [Stutzerimonas azotifigens]|uniref:LysR family transcriptional regulator n=1 Tax=Stutzerimonas azotifigens TaxID=291995 RepID=A0ABR5YV31_9GAMM|nr:LysR family transcriptional regulator [Stutzerimonas azotifigens]MBA1271781.1 LysR family transcriptional regulator [Stutzerimonas azotifigens]
MKLDLQEIETYLRVVELGGVSRAAEDLALSKSVVSKRLSDLEQRLGAKLLHRSTRKVAPTDSGMAFYTQAKEALFNLGEAAEAAAFNDSGLCGRLHVLAPMSFGTLWLAPLIAEFMRQHPRLEISLHLEDRISDFEREGYDLCVRISRIGDSALIARKLASSARILCASPDYLQQRGAPENIEALRGHECIGYSNVSSRQFWSFENTDEQGELANVAPRGRFSSNNGEVMREVVLAGLGLALLPSFLVHHHLKAGSLIEVLPHARPKPYSIYAMYPRSSRASRKVAALCDFLQQRLVEPPWEQH